MTPVSGKLEPSAGWALSQDYELGASVPLRLGLPRPRRLRLPHCTRWFPSEHKVDYIPFL